MPMFIVRAPVARSRAVVGDAQQDREQREVGDERRAAVGDERQRDAGERDHACHAADDQERLEAEDRRDARREELRERPGRVGRDAERAADEQHERGDDADRADEAELLADRGEHEVGRGVGDEVGAAEPEPGAADAAGAERVLRLDDLVAGALTGPSTG